MDADRTQPDKMSELALHWGKAQLSVSAYVRSVVRNHHDAEDIVQATVSYIAHHFEEYDPARPFEAWAIGIARYRIMEHRHQSQRKPLLMGDEALDALSDAMAIESVQMHERLEALEHCVGRLSPKHQRVLAKRYREHATRESIADAFGIKLNSVSVLLRRVRQVLAQCVERRMGGKSA